MVLKFEIKNPFLLFIINSFIPLVLNDIIGTPDARDSINVMPKDSTLDKLMYISEDLYKDIDPDLWDQIRLDIDNGIDIEPLARLHIILEIEV